MTMDGQRATIPGAEDDHLTETALRDRIRDEQLLAHLADEDAHDARLEIFRQVRPAVERPSVLASLPVRDVPLAGLLEDLSDVAAALRLRKAA
jgi:hypothetical protein